MTYIAELIGVGTELLLGQTANTDAQMLSQGLSALGIGVYHHTVVGDNPERLKDAVHHARGRANIIITTGGLGPTYDDMTKKTVAEAFGKELVLDPHSEARIRGYFAESGRTMTENNLQQAMIPVGATAIDNYFGTAPGVLFQEGDTHVVMLPGPPRECTPMFHNQVMPYLAGLSHGCIHSRSLRIFGMGESAVETLLRDTMEESQNPTLAPYAKVGEVELRITAKAETVEEAEALIVPMEEYVRSVVGDKIYGADVNSLEEVVLAQLKEQGLTLGTAESCTGGLLAKRITDLSGASAVFMGGMVTYSNQMKIQLLDVDATLLDTYGAVSPEVAQEMAKGARLRLGCDLAVATTGVAGPDSDDRGNPVGLVYVALSTKDGTYVEKTHMGGGRDRVRTIAASHGLDMVRRHLEGKL